VIAVSDTKADATAAQGAANLRRRGSDLQAAWPAQQPAQARRRARTALAIIGQRYADFALLVYIDDATSRLMHLRFVETESTFAYFAATQGYLEAHGKPVAFYSDKHSVFRVAKAGVTGDGMTQFGRALHALNIEIICANTSQAKGRIERANKTLQDRLVKEMRLAGVSTLEAGNAFQSGNSSLRLIGSMMAPERMWPPTSEPFSSTATDRSIPAERASCLRRMAAESPDGRLRR
jgi:hypothetical protein